MRTPALAWAEILAKSNMTPAQKKEATEVLIKLMKARFLHGQQAEALATLPKVPEEFDPKAKTRRKILPLNFPI
tara:strand:- start:8776 stop:8997 length:222 start_codon:yes stop_codon:yes gene_type:complete